MTKIVIDPGHGGGDAGASYNRNLEKSFNLSMALTVRNYLQEHYEATIIMTRTSDNAVSLQERTNLANSEKADFYLSIHNNSAGGNGFESYIYNGNVAEQTKAYQSVIHNEIMNMIQSKYKIKDRGKKRANFHVLRESKMPALLLEVLFVDNPADVELLNNPAFISDVSIAIARGVAKALNLSEKQISANLFRVIAGSFKKRENANERVEYLKSKGIAAFIAPTTISGQQYYRVQAGAFSNKVNAEERVNALKQIGISDAFIKTERAEEEAPASPIKHESLSIIGEMQLFAHQLDHFVKTVNPAAPQLGQYYVKYGELYRIRGDVAYAQAIHETNYFKFTGLVKQDQNNYAGIGATGPGSPGHRFSSPEEGVHAHLQHLFAYSSIESIPSGHPEVDPRFHLVTRGSATTWTELNGKWAVPGTGYGENILLIYKRMVNDTKLQLQEQINRLEALLKEI